MRPPASAISHSWPEEEPTTPEATGLRRRGDVHQPGNLAHMTAPPPPQAGLPDSEDVFDHLRREDGERMGSIEISAAGQFIPYDRLWVRRRDCAQPPERALPAGAVTGPGAAIGARSPG